MRSQRHIFTVRSSHAESDPAESCPGRFELLKTGRPRPRSAALPLAFLLFISITAALPAQITLTNPSIPDKESITYVRSSEHGTEMVYVEMRLIGPSGGSNPGREPYYEYRVKSDSKEMLVKLTADTLEAFYSEVWEKNTYSTIHRNTEIVEQNKPVDDGELLLCDGNGLDVSLRGFPWDRHDEAILVFLNSSDKFQFKMKVEGRETLRINDVSYTCYKVQLALGGFIGSLFPKSYFWYSVDSPHILVRAEAAGMMGDDSYEMELVSYSSAGE